MSHFIEVCVCGITLAQCRCMGEKERITVSPCKHNIAKRDVLTFDKIAASYAAVIMKGKDIPEKFTCSQQVYDQLCDWAKQFALDQLGKPVDVVGELDTSQRWTIFGAEIEIDEGMKPNEWKFE